MTLINCDCSVDLNDYERAAISDYQWRMARRQHECCECDDPIRPGDRYEYASVLSDGRWGHYRTCEVCVRVRNHYCPRGYIFGGLADQIMDCLGFDYRNVPETDEGKVRK